MTELGADGTRALGGLLRRWRERALLTQEQLAERTGLAARTIRALEASVGRRPRSGSLRLLAEALGLSEQERELLTAARGRLTALRRVGDEVVRQLPADVADFTGRGDQVGLLEELLGGGRGLGATAVAVCAVAGGPGVGKTALAVHVAHRLREQFGDGQLYVDLRGVEASPAQPGEVLAEFLRALGVDGAALPAGCDQRAGLYRSLLASRRVLVVLDNAASEAQVGPLLPGSPSCGVLVTSRRRLGALVGARLVDLGVLEPDQALQLLRRIVGHARVAAEPQAAAQLARLCGWLPLALRIAGARLAARPHWRLGELAERLADERRRLDELAYGQLEARSSLKLSYRGLNPAARVLFRRLGLLEAPDVAAWVGAALLEESVERAQELLEELVEARLLEVAGEDDADSPNRYRFHDLVRLYARERAHAEEPSTQVTLALGRALGGWLALLERANRTAYGGDYALIHGGAPRWLPHQELVDQLVADPVAWFEGERLALAAAIRQAAEQGMDELRWDLALTAQFS